MSKRRTCIHPHAICTLTNAKPIIIAAQTLKRCSINRKWLSPNFYFRLELCAIYHSERYEGGALGHAGRWYYSAITWGKMEDLRASKCIHVMAFLLVSRWIIRRYYILKFFNVSSSLCLTLPQWPEILFVTIEFRSALKDSSLINSTFCAISNIYLFVYCFEIKKRWLEK